MDIKNIRDMIDKALAENQTNLHIPGIGNVLIYNEVNEELLIEFEHNQKEYLKKEEE